VNSVYIYTSINPPTETMTRNHEIKFSGNFGQNVPKYILDTVPDVPNVLLKSKYFGSDHPEIVDVHKANQSTSTTIEEKAALCFPTYIDLRRTLILIKVRQCMLHPILTIPTRMILVGTCAPWYLPYFRTVQGRGRTPKRLMQLRHVHHICTADNALTPTVSYICSV
jgi:hypothetical protein